MVRYPGKKEGCLNYFQISWELCQKMLDDSINDNKCHLVHKSNLQNLSRIIRLWHEIQIDSLAFYFI